MASETWQRVGRVLMCHVDMRFVVRGRISNANAPPPQRTTMRPAEFLELMDLDASNKNETDPAA